MKTGENQLENWKKPERKIMARKRKSNLTFFLRPPKHLKDLSGNAATRKPCANCVVKYYWMNGKMKLMVEQTR
jgi:hypothetical protein